MADSTLHVIDPVESKLGSGLFTFAETLALAAKRAEESWNYDHNDSGPGSETPTVPVAALLPAAA
jgi:hypothetical protein